VEAANFSSNLILIAAGWAIAVAARLRADLAIRPRVGSNLMN
jgi:hypothetical protein